ncbi:MAG TPA: hypothetical protein PK689_06490 [Kiritimatiellia bacterium]|nr:hypothetical protein [Kiritimatiellia bacterium]
MNKPAHPKSRQTGSVSVLLLLVLCFLVYAAAVAGYAVWSYREHKKTLMAEIDHDLLQAARSLKYLLANDFHDRALDKDSIGKDEELRNRRLVTDFGVESGFKWVYTLAEKDGKFFFSAPSVSEEEAKELDSWYFYPYEDVPEEFVAAFRENRTVYVEYTDQWGTFRSVAVPERSPGGRLYLACADREIGDIDALLRRNLLQSAAVAAFFLLASLPFILLLTHVYRAHTADLKRLNAELRAHKDNLEIQVQQRTAELRQETERLQEALANVRTLSGLIPICAHCKKIRDDKGYWNQLEIYIQKNSDALFSHGLCPDCVQELYPEFANADEAVPPPAAPPPSA